MKKRLFPKMKVGPKRIWLPASLARRIELANTFKRMAELVMEAPRSTGLD